MSTRILGRIIDHGANHGDGGRDELSLGVHDETSLVLSAGSAQTFTDIDCSSICGSRRCLIFLRCHGVNDCIWHLRTKGVVYDPSSGSGYGGLLSGYSKTGADQIGLVVSDTSGVIQYRTHLAGRTINAYVAGFMPFG